MTLEKFACPCCGHKTFNEEPSGTYGICPVCYWEDDPFQLENPSFAVGANKVSLTEAQKNFMEFGACELEMKKHVRKPFKDEPKDENWKPID